MRLNFRFISGQATRMKWAAVALTGALALSSQVMERFRFLSPERLATQEFIVTNGADSGAGSLREGIVAADRAGKRARLVVAVSEVLVETPLPPLVNPHGIVIDASKSHARLLVNNTGGQGPILDVATENVALLGLQIVAAPDEAILVRSRGARVQAVDVENSGGGVLVADGVDDLVISDSVFRANRVGIQVPATARGIIIQSSRFEGHRQAAIWSVAPVPRPADRSADLIVIRNRFTRDERSLLVINGDSRIERNQIDSARLSAIYVNGSTTIIASNRVRAGVGFGIEAVDLTYAAIADNEIDHNCAGGILLRASQSAHVTANRIYANGSGVVAVDGDPLSPNVVDDNLITGQVQDGLHVIGGSPVLRHNQLLQNRFAALRFSALVSGGRRIRVPDPHLELNVAYGNGTNEPQRDEYVAAPDPARVEEHDCSWRLGRSNALLQLPGAAR